MTLHPIFQRIPIFLTCLRALLGPSIVICAYLWPKPALLVSCVVLAFLSDVFDGIIARRLGVATASLRRLDSIADSIFTFVLYGLYGFCIPRSFSIMRVCSSPLQYWK